MFFKNWTSLVEIIIMAVLVYSSIIVILRLSGKRTLSDLNAFDFIVSVTIGSIAGTTILSSTTSLSEGIVAVVTLVLLQYIVAKLDVHFKSVSKLLKSNPTLLYYNGEYLEKNMKKMRITKQDILQEVRYQGGTVIESVDAIILESHGKISVITFYDKEKGESLKQYA